MPEFFLLPGGSEQGETARIVDNRNGFARVTLGLDLIKGKLGTTELTMDSIPRTTAYIQYMEERIRSIQRNDNTNWQDLNKWEGILAIIGLSEIYGFNVTIKPAFSELSAITQKILEEDLKRELLNENQNLNTGVAIFEKDGVPIAITHKTMLICPFCEIDPEVFFGCSLGTESRK